MLYIIYLKLIQADLKSMYNHLWEIYRDSLAYIQTVTCFAFNLYMPLVFFMSCGDLLFRLLCKMLATLKAMFKLVYWNRLVTLHTSGL